MPDACQTLQGCSSLTDENSTTGHKRTEEVVLEFATALRRLGEEAFETLLADRLEDMLYQHLRGRSTAQRIYGEPTLQPLLTLKSALGLVAKLEVLSLGPEISDRFMDKSPRNDLTQQRYLPSLRRNFVQYRRGTGWRRYPTLNHSQWRSREQRRDRLPLAVQTYPQVSTAPMVHTRLAHKYLDVLLGTEVAHSLINDARLGGKWPAGREPQDS
ncbi:hypothetical protein FGIG_04300 [Fasciola gigantica]|uniref:Uncharacterized protein n=1 Tax=Fasciola gigantica TaxID=46835 RepID=A0A504YJF3_FASGI|nr:hypothetical protein FGIG_04300 [Fasciola gigantica]